MATGLYLAVEKRRQYRPIASPYMEAMLQLLCESAPECKPHVRSSIV